jgi:hypothetical protein
LPSSTREAIIASPKFHQKKQETVSVKHEASPHKVSKPAVTTSKEQWLKRYKGSYPGKRDSRGDNIDLLSISQAEPVDQSFIARDTVLLAVESKADKLKVPPIEKVQEWLQRNVHAFEQAPARSPESTTVTVAADVHRGLDEEIDLLSVSQQRSYIAPRKADVGALRNSSERLRCTYNKVKQASNEKTIFTSRVGNEDNTQLCERVKDEQNVEDDPYEFISSQKTGTLSKKKLKRKKKGETAVQKTEVKNFEVCGPSLKGGDDKNPNENNCNSPPVSDFMFTCPIEINDTFDNLVANSHKPELKKTVKTDTTKVVAGHNNSDDMCLFRTPLEVPASSQDNGGSTTESMSDVDFSSGSSEEWGESNQMKQNPIQVSSVRTRSSSHNLPAKKSPTRSTSRPTAGKKSSGIFPRRNEKLEVLKSSSKEASKQKLQINPVKPKPLSPIKKVNLNTDVEDFNTVNMKQHPGVCNDSNKRSEDEFVACLSLDKAHTGKENVICPATVKYGVNENKKNLECTAMNTTVCSRSPGWSRISQSKKDFERFKKPALKALNVSGGEVCTSKKHVISVSDVTMERDIMKEVMSPLPTIDDSDSSVGIPVVAFDSPEAPNRVEMMSRIVMDLEHQIGPNSSTGNIAEITTEAFTPHSVKDVTLKKCVSFSSDAFSDPMNALDSPKSCHRKELIHAVLSSLEDVDEDHCNEGNERIMSGITKLSEGETDSQDNYKKVNDNVNNPVVDTTDTILIVQESNSILAHEEATENTECNEDIHNKDNGNFTVLTVQESNSIMAHEEATENIEHNQDIHNKDTGNIKKNLVVDISDTVFIVQETNSTMTHEEATKNIEHTQEKNSPVVDSNETVFAIQESSSTMAHEAATENIEHNQDKCNRDNGNIKNSLAVDSNETVFVVQESGSTMAHKEAAENTEHKQYIHTKAHGNVMKNQIVDVSRNNVLMAQDSCSATRHEEVAENTQYNQDSHNKDNDNIQKNHVFDIGKKNILMVQESHSITTRDEAMENIQRNLLLDQNIIPPESDCSKMTTSFDLKRKCDKGASLENLNNQTEKPTEAVQNGNILTEQLPANSSLAASTQDLQALILSKKCNEEKLALSSSDIIINSKTQENSLFRPCTTKEPQLQPQIISTEPMEITTEKFHQTEIQSSCNSSVGLVNSYPNKMHIPFIKCGRLTSSKLFTKFILRGSLAPRGKNVPPETLQELSSADSLGVQSGLLQRQSQSMNCENGTQTSPGLLHLKMNPTQVYPKLVQPTISTGTINHTQGHSEDFVPDSCESTHAFPCAIPLPQHSVARQTLKDSHKCSDPGDSLRICRTSEPLNVDIYTEDNSVESNVNMNRTAVLRNQCQYHEPGDGMEHDVSTSQFSMENTVKVQQITASPNGGHSPELPSNLVTHTGLTKPILQETNTGKTVNTDHDKCDAHTSQKAISAIVDGQPDHEERKSKSHQQNKIMVPRTDNSAGWLTEDLRCKNSEHKQNNYGNSFAEKGRKTTSRQLVFSPNFIPKLSDPTLDVNTEDGEKDVQKLHKKSYKRIRVASASSDSVSAGSGSDDISDSETREIKKPCHTSVRKASRSDKDNEVLICKEDAETSPGVIELLTSSEESNCGHIAPKGDDKTNNEGKWLGDDVPDSEELMARVMANIEADLVRTRKRKMTEGKDRQEMRESPTLFTPPPPFVADSEELGSRMTFELVVSDSEVEHKKKPIRKSFLGNTAVGNDSESLSMQHRNKTQVSIYKKVSLSWCGAVSSVQVHISVISTL